MMGASESAGVVAQSNWNNATGATAQHPALTLRRTGTATSAGVTWTSNNNGWMTPIADQAGNQRMMKGYLDTSSTSTTTVT